MYTQPSWSSLSPRSLDGAVGMTSLSGCVTGSGRIDPTEEVRVTLAQLTARARQLAVGDGCTQSRLLASNSQSLLDASQQTVRTAAQAYAGSSVMSDSVPSQQQQQHQMTIMGQDYESSWLPPPPALPTGSSDLPPPFFAICPAAPMGEGGFVDDGLTATSAAAPLARVGGRCMTSDTNMLIDSNRNVTPASVDLFMSRQLGVDVQEQQRLLQHLHNRQAATLAEYGLTPDLAETDASLLGAALPPSTGGDAKSPYPPYGSNNVIVVNGNNSGGGGFGGVNNDVSDEVSAAVAQMKAQVSSQARAAQHQRLREQLHHREYALFKTAWEPYFVHLQGELAAQDVESSMTPLLLQQQHGMYNGAECAPGAELRSQRGAGLVQLLFGNSPQSIMFARRAAAFALYVYTQPPDAWTDCFADYVDEQQGEMESSNSLSVQQGSNLIARGDGVLYSDAEDAQNDLLMASFWQTVRTVLNQVRRAGSSATATHYLAASRAALEEAALRRLLMHTLGLPISQLEEQAIQTIPASRVLEALMCCNNYSESGMGLSSASPSDAWMQVYGAMRVGRYDVALLAAERLGSAALTAALRRCEAAGKVGRVSLSRASELQSMYLSAAHANDTSAKTGADASYNAVSAPYKQAVLLLLLAGYVPSASMSSTPLSRAASAALGQRTLLQLCSRIAQSIEEALWLRLCCVRQIQHNKHTTHTSALHEASSLLSAPRLGTNVPRPSTTEEAEKEADSVQSLSQLHKVILDDIPSLIPIIRGNPVRLASFLFHALMPSAALRVLLARDTTYLDGLHMALCCHHTDLFAMLPGESSTIDVGRYVMQYASLILLDWNAHRARDGLTIHESTVYHYFLKTRNEEAFVELCQRPTVCARLFGLQSYRYDVSSKPHTTTAQGESDNNCNSSSIHQHHRGSGSHITRSNSIRAPDYTRHDPLIASGESVAADAAVPSPDMLALLSRVAERSAARGAVAQAIQVYTALAYSAYRAQNNSAIRVALRRAVELACTALAQTLTSDAGRNAGLQNDVESSPFTLNGCSAAVTQLIACTTQLHAVTCDFTAKVDNILTTSQAATFDDMYDMAYIYTLILRGEVETALERVLQIRFLINARHTAGGEISELAQTLSEQPTSVLAALNGLMPYVIDIAQTRLIRLTQEAPPNPDDAFDVAINMQNLRERVRILCSALLMASDSNPLMEITCQRALQQFLQWSS